MYPLPLPSGYDARVRRSPAGFAGAGLLLVAGVLLGQPCRAQAVEQLVRPPGILTLTAGFGAPYGCGLDYGNRVIKNLEATMGAGFDFSGFKTGIGARYYLWGTQTKFATFVGANVIYCAGRESVTLVTHEDNLYFQDETAEIRIHPCAVGRLRAGLYWQPGKRLGLMTALGYGLLLGSDPVQYLNTATPSEGMRAVVATRRPNSPELSLGVFLRLEH